METILEKEVNKDIVDFSPEKIVELLDGFEKTWFPNELAILFANSRTESNIRDKYNLHFANLLKENERYFIQREWKRTDLAIVENNDGVTSPSVLFEFKIRHTSFIARGDGKSTLYGDKHRTEYKNGVYGDLEKLDKYENDCSCYSILIGVHPLQPIPEKYNVFKGDCKEIEEINKKFERFGNADVIKSRCDSNISRFCEKENRRFHKFEYKIGRALDVDWEMLIWIIYK